MKYAPFLFFLVCGEEKSVFNKKKNEKVWCVMKKQYLCSVKNGTGGSVERLDYGVMVTQQILVLFFQVRVLVVQRNGLKIERLVSITCKPFVIRIIGTKK